MFLNEIKQYAVQFKIFCNPKPLFANPINFNRLYIFFVDDIELKVYNGDVPNIRPKCSPLCVDGLKVIDVNFTYIYRGLNYLVVDGDRLSFGSLSHLT